MTKYVVFLIYSHLDKVWRLPHLQSSLAESCVSIMELLHFPLQHSSCLSPGSSCTAVIMRTSSIFPCSSRHYYIRHDSWQRSSFKKIGVFLIYCRLDDVWNLQPLARQFKLWRNPQRNPSSTVILTVWYLHPRQLK